MPDIADTHYVMIYDKTDGMWFACNPGDTEEIFGTDYSLPAALKAAKAQGFDCTYWRTPDSYHLESTAAIRRS